MPSPSLVAMECLTRHDRSAGGRATDLLLLTALAGLLFFYGLSAGQFRGTECLRAIVAAEFLRSGNWVVPMLYGEPLFTKPPGMYAAIALASWPFGGVSEWTARLPSALAATVVLLLVYWYFSRQLGRGAGLVAALVVPLGPLWLEKASSAEIDMLQTAWVTGAVLFFLRALEAEEGTAAEASPAPGRGAWPWWIASLVCVGAGVLTKWTAPAFFYLTAVPLLWWRGRLRLLLGRRHLVSATLAAGLCLAWVCAAVCLDGWDVFRRTVANEALQRLSPAHSPRPYPWAASLLHPLKLIIFGLPTSAAALVTLRPGFTQLWDRPGRRLLQALHCWTWPSMVFWSLPTEHTPRHSLPLFPGLAGLAALVVIAWFRGGLRWRPGWLNPRRVLVGGLAAWLTVKLVFVEVAVQARHPWGGPRVAAQVLGNAVPHGAVLYIIHLKDEGIMFYYGRTVRRAQSASALPAGGPLWCVLTADEWRCWDHRRPARLLCDLYDGQGAPIVLVRLAG